MEECIIHQCGSRIEDWPPPLANTEVLVSLKEFDDDLGLRTRVDLQRQLTVDLPRCLVFLDGTRVWDASLVCRRCRLPKFCTQVVMAPVLEWALHSGLLLHEIRTYNPLTVYVSGCTVVAKKRLGVWRHDESSSVVNICVTADTNRNLVLLSWREEAWPSPPMREVDPRIYARNHSDDTKLRCRTGSRPVDDRVVGFAPPSTPVVFSDVHTGRSFATTRVSHSPCRKLTHDGSRGLLRQSSVFFHTVTNSDDDPREQKSVHEGHRHPRKTAVHRTFVTPHRVRTHAAIERPHGVHVVPTQTSTRTSLGDTVHDDLGIGIGEAVDGIRTTAAA